MASEVDICNMALSHLGNSKEIAILATEKSEEAAACRRFYETARDTVLRDFAWPFATRILSLGLVEEDPNDEWAYAYRYPTDCLLLRRLLSGLRNDNRQSRAPYRVARDDDGLVIYTDLAEAQMEYTVRETDPNRFPPDFTLALSYRLAVLLASRITAGDPFKLVEKSFNLYQIELGNARAQAGNEEQPDETPQSEFIRDRE